MIASDTVMPVPYIVGGDLDDLIASLAAIKQKNLENLVQGHGEVLLRGEIEETLDANINYLKTIDRLVAVYRPWGAAQRHSGYHGGRSGAVADSAGRFGAAPPSGQLLTLTTHTARR